MAFVEIKLPGDTVSSKESCAFAPSLLSASVTVAKAEFKRVILMLLRYPIGTLATSVILSLVFVGIFETGRNMFNSGDVSSTELVHMVQSFVLWSAMIVGFGGIASSIRDETKSGLIEVLWMGRLPAAAVLTLRGVLSCGVVILMCTLIAIALSLTYAVPGVVTLSLLVAIALVIPAAIGVGLIFGALIILFKEIGPSVNLLQFLLLPLFMAYEGLSLPTAFLPGVTGLDVLACDACDPVTWTVIVGIPLAWFLIGLLSCALAVRVSKKRALVYEY